MSPGKKHRNASNVENMEVSQENEAKKTNKRSLPKGRPTKSNKQMKKIRPTTLNPVPKNDRPFNFNSPEDFMTSLLAPEVSLEDFFAHVWGKKPLHITSATRGIQKLSVNSDKNAARDVTVESYFHKLFNVELLKQISGFYTLEYGVDMNACRYDGKKREDFSLLSEERVWEENIKKMMDDHKMTIQFHQPQRFHDELWKILEIMESYFGCLVGSNVYLTPEGTQGLAPHYDDVEVFILQLEGSKDWKLYSPVQKLARECSRDLDERTMKSLDLILEITLNPGDILYFPRGTVHEAKVRKGCGPSTHITISTYQNHCWGDQLVTSVPHLIDKCTDKSETFREGLPVMGMKKFSPKDTVSKFSNLLDSLKTFMSENLTEFERSSTLECDFYANRLPPFNAAKDPVGKIPSLKSSVRFVRPDHVLISRGRGLYEDSDDEDFNDNDDDDDDENDLHETTSHDDKHDMNETFIYHSLANKRSDHMIGSPSVKPTALRFDIGCLEPLRRLKESGKNFIKIEDLGLPSHIGLDLLVGLWAECLLECSEH